MYRDKKNENFHDFKKLTKDEYCGHLILLSESTSEVENKYYPQTFLDTVLKKSDKNEKTVNGLFKEVVEIVDWSDDEFE